MRHPRGIINAGAHSSLLRKLSYNIPVVSERVAFTSSRIVFFEFQYNNLLYWVHTQKFVVL